jgi:hypothetical protein
MRNTGIDVGNSSGGIWALEYLSENGTDGVHLSCTPFSNIPVIRSQLFFRNNGYVGIGNRSPQYELDVSGIIHSQIVKITGNSFSQGFDISYSKNKLFLKQRENANFYIEGMGGGLVIAPDGNIGMGTDFPQAKLHLFDENLRITKSISKGLGEGGGISFEMQSTVMIPGWIMEYDGYNSSSGLNIGKPWSEGLEHVLFLNDDGNVGVGTAAPKQKLHLIDGNILISKTSTKATGPGSPNGSILFGDDVTNSQNGRWGIEYVNSSTDGYGLNFWKCWNPSGGTWFNYGLFLADDGNVGVGKKDPQAKLDVAGAFKATSANITGKVEIGSSSSAVNLDVTGVIRAEEVRVCLNQGCDFVFEDDYELMDLNDLNKFIKTHKHLPDVAPAAEMEADGINLSEMSALFLKKIEELTLYILELQKQIDDLKSNNL